MFLIKLSNTSTVSAGPAIIKHPTGVRCCLAQLLSRHLKLANTISSFKWLKSLL